MRFYCLSWLAAWNFYYGKKLSLFVKREYPQGVGVNYIYWWLVLLLFIKLPPLRSSLFIKRDSIFIA